MAKGAELSRIDLETRFIFPKWLKEAVAATKEGRERAVAQHTRAGDNPLSLFVRHADLQGSDCRPGPRS